MIVDKVFQNKDKTDTEIIYQLKSGINIIKRDDEIIKKFNISKWDELSFIPSHFQEIDRNITKEEEQELKRFLSSRKKKQNFFCKTWQKSKNKLLSILKKKEKP
ncbi:MAG: hypothetical protein ACOCQO_02525 [Halanaerobiaceae bacterium]